MRKLSSAILALTAGLALSASTIAVNAHGGSGGGMAGMSHFGGQGRGVSGGHNHMAGNWGGGGRGHSGQWRGGGYGYGYGYGSGIYIGDDDYSDDQQCWYRHHRRYCRY